MRQKGFVDNAIGMRHRNFRDRLVVLRHYGGQNPICKCCDATELSFLSIDHIDGGGNTEREAELGGKLICGHHMYRWLIKKGFPLGYQVLCMNCQVGRRDNAERAHISWKSRQARKS